MPPRPSEVARQRLIATAAGLGVAALAAAAFVLSYDDLRVLALTGGATHRYAPVYPIMIDALVIVTILSLVVARRTRWWARGVRWLLLLALLAGAAAAGAQRAVKGYGPLPDKWLSAGVAVAPWVLLLIAAWLWLSMFRQARLLFARPGAGGPGGRYGELPPTSTVRVVSPPADVARPHPAEQLIPGLDLPATPLTTPLTTPPTSAATSAATTTGPVQPSAPVPSSLPTDIKLVTHRPASTGAAPTTGAETAATETTQPDIVIPRRRTAAEGSISEHDPATHGDPAHEYPREDMAVADESAADDPGTESPGVDDPGTESPGVDDSAAEKPGAENPGAENPGADDSGTEHPGTENPDTEDDVERWSALAAEDAQRWAEEAADHFSGAPQPNPTPAVEWIPPASKFRSSPTPPRD